MKMFPATSLLVVIVVVLAWLGSYNGQQEKIGTSTKHRLIAMTIAGLMKSKEGHVTYKSHGPISPENSHLIHIEATVSTDDRFYTIIYMVDTRPKETKDHLGDFLQIEDLKTKERFSDPKVEGTPEFTNQVSFEEKLKWVEKYRRALEMIHVSI